MVAGTLSKSGKLFVSIFHKDLCRKNSCFKKSGIKCKYCDLSFCKVHRAPLPDENRNDFEGKGHSCDKFPKNKTMKEIIKEYPYLTEHVKLPPDTIPPINPKKPKTINKWVWIVIGLVLLVLFLFLIFKEIKSQDTTYTGPRCEDGTHENSCSKQKPYFCANRQLVEAGYTCGCPKGYINDFQSCKKIEDTHSKEKTASDYSTNIIEKFLYKLDTWINDIDTNSNKNNVKPTINDKSPDYNEINIQSPLKPNIDVSSLEKQIHDLINVERQNNGLSALSFDSQLSDIARDHSEDMAQNNFFDHYNLIGQDPTARATARGYNCYKDYGSYYVEGIAENIFQNNLYDSITYINMVPIYNWNSQEEIAQSTVQGWMNSPGHRQNILTSTYDREGIGVAISSNDNVYITEDFC